MNRIEKLIEEMCPEGVAHKRLKDVAKISRGKSITKKDLQEGTVPVIAGGRNPAYFHDTANREPHMVAVAGSGAYSGFVSYWDKPVWISDAFSLEFDDRETSGRFFYHYLLSKQSNIYDLQSGGGVPHVYPSNVGALLVPVPRLEIQKEIVNILDKFTQLEAELEAELEAREKQYEEVRRRLLDFESDTSNHPLGEMIREMCPEEVLKYRLDEVFEIRGGYTPSKSNPEYWEDGSVPWFRMDDIRSAGRILGSSSQLISKSAVKTRGLFPADSLIMSTSATIGEHALIRVPFVANQRFSVLQRRDGFTEKLDMKFAFYLGYGLGEYCKDNTSVSGFASVVMNAFKSYLLPVPPLEIQKEIVRILDNLDSLVNSVNEGIPAEIAARRKQYEYYRDKLLTFKELDAA